MAAAFQFPAAPTTGQIYTPTPGIDYEWNGYAWIPVSMGALTLAEANALYVPKTELPPGVIMDYAAAGVPPGWFLCDGTAKNRTVYAALFAAIGTLWGAGNGSTTFNVPPAGRQRINAGPAITVGNQITGGSGVVTAGLFAIKQFMFDTGMPVLLSDLTVISGIVAGTHWIVRVNSTHVGLATSLVNALTGVYNTVAAGTGTFTITYNGRNMALGEVGGQSELSQPRAAVGPHTHISPVHSHTTSLQKANGGSGGDFGTGLPGAATAYAASNVAVTINQSATPTEAMDAYTPYAVFNQIIKY